MVVGGVLIVLMFLPISIVYAVIAHREQKRADALERERAELILELAVRTSEQAAEVRKQQFELDMSQVREKENE